MSRFGSMNGFSLSIGGEPHAADKVLQLAIEEACTELGYRLVKEDENGKWKKRVNASRLSSWLMGSLKVGYSSTRANEVVRAGHAVKVPIQDRIERMAINSINAGADDRAMGLILALTLIGSPVSMEVLEDGRITGEAAKLVRDKKAEVVARARSRRASTE